MLLFFGRLLAFSAILLQIAVFLQSLLPEKYQISPVCETIALVIQQNYARPLGSSLLNQTNHTEHVADLNHQHHNHSHQHATDHHQTSVFNAHLDSGSHHHHDPGHQCQYCVVYSHILPLPDLDLKHILVRIQVRLVAFQESTLHVYFQLQRLYLLPQGRAPPTLLSF